MGGAVRVRLARCHRGAARCAGMPAIFAGQCQRKQCVIYSPMELQGNEEER